MRDDKFVFNVLMLRIFGFSFGVPKVAGFQSSGYVSKESYTVQVGLFQGRVW